MSFILYYIANSYEPKNNNNAPYPCNIILGTVTVTTKLVSHLLSVEQPQELSLDDIIKNVFGSLMTKN